MSDDDVPLRERLHELCAESGGTVHETAQALVDVLLFVLLWAAPSADAAERDARPHSTAKTASVC